MGTPQLGILPLCGITAVCKVFKPGDGGERDIEVIAYFASMRREKRWDI